MANPFELVILKLQALGFYGFLLPFILVAAIIYGLLRKSQLFGPPEKNVSINAVVALVASFMVWASPIIAGISIEEHLAKFFVQSMVATLVLMIAILMAGMVLPTDLPKFIGEKFGTKPSYIGVFIVAGIIIGLTLLVTSGLTGVFFPEGIVISEDVLVGVGTIIALLIVVGLIVVFTSREGKK